MVWIGCCRFIPTHVGNTGRPGPWAVRQTVHPHACGEYSSVLMPCVAHSGSSPRMWGIRAVKKTAPRGSRFIPTHVGNTSCFPVRRSSASVHPHACGEYMSASKEQKRSSGSSPRMWGIQRNTKECRKENRFIPTHVGNTAVGFWRTPFTSVHPHACGEYSCPEHQVASSSGSSPRMWGIRGAWGWPPRRRPVHPHACGEYVAAYQQDLPDSGSSPRMWGIHLVHTNKDTGQRFIPTHVGNTSKSMLPWMSTTVHPHACGEYFFKRHLATDVRGSSPRMWGIRIPPQTGRKFQRFIPTHVGNTPCISQYRVINAVHPHACGEYAGSLARRQCSSGSSPRMWGILDMPKSSFVLYRFIPTHVGNTWPSQRRERCVAVHPHACGEYLGSLPRKADHDGSSPRMWGIPRRGGQIRGRGRFIPTHVGNTA